MALRVHGEEKLQNEDMRSDLGESIDESHTFQVKSDQVCEHLVLDEHLEGDKQ